METKFKVGDKVRILNVAAIQFGEKWLKPGDVREVVRVDFDGDIYVRVDEKVSGKFIISRDEFHAIERINPQSKKRRIEILEKEVARQETELDELRAKIESFEQKAKSAVWLSDGMRKATPNQRRAQIIADAKQFVEETLERAISDEQNYEGNDVFRYFTTRVHFVVKPGKREVTAVSRGAYGSGKLYGKAIAKCAPDDVFNADIGKAIAVGRLFGLDVDKFVDAPKPTEFTVGHVVQIAEVNDSERVYGVGKITDNAWSSSRYYFDPATFKSDGYRPIFSMPIGTPRGSKIIDDTEAQYEQ